MKCSYVNLMCMYETYVLYICSCSRVVLLAQMIRESLTFYCTCHLNCGSVLEYTCRLLEIKKVVEMSVTSSLNQIILKSDTLLYPVGIIIVCLKVTILSYTCLFRLFV